ncbi:forkhead box protein R1 isoform X2 [Mauremys reevesii]|uniref:forkhead box protein R1 isoform X2 n=1 Tax=Mauremys reevesii TaxID=260615 RepID=UPI00193F822E|nr:forkhead box protein R1 isoform X2 [Mauremys reevesii]
MYLNFQNKTFWENLHLKSGLEDWDMEEKLKLTTTTDQFPHAADEKLNHHMLKWQCERQVRRNSLHKELSETLPSTQPREFNVQPHLWMWVNPNLVCPIAGCPSVDMPGPSSPAFSVAATAPGFSSPSPSLNYSNLDCSEEDLLSSSSEAEKFTEDEDASSVDISLPQKMETPKSKAILALRKPKVPRCQSKKLKYILQASTKIKGGWPRPPLNYCILITLALRNNAEGSLTVQQIYQFTRQHFPFFQTAPDGWKNSIRHNLCFSSSFEKTSHFVCNEGNRKSRLWKLTPEGCRKFQEEVRALSEEALDLVSQSLNKPDAIFVQSLIPAASEIRTTWLPSRLMSSPSTTVSF